MTRLRTHSWLRNAAAVALLATPALALAAPDLGAAQKQPLNWHAIGMFFAFVLLVAFAPQVIALRLFEGSHLTVGIALGFAQFVFFCALTWVYVRRANGEFDVLNAQIVQDALRKTA